MKQPSKVEPLKLNCSHYMVSTKMKYFLVCTVTDATTKYMSTSDENNIDHGCIVPQQ